MARLSRYTQLIFGSNATVNQIAEFGSLAAGTPQTYSGSTITPTIVQTLSNYLTGWFGAIIGSNSPAIEDMNAIFWLITYQLAYLMELGVPEWDSGTTYYTGSIVQSGGIQYVSLANSNLNNAVTNGAFWGQQVQNGTVTPNALPANTIVATGDTLTWPNLTVPTGLSLTVNTGANLIGFTNLTLAGTATLVLSGTAVARIL